MAFDPWFRVLHRKVTANRDMNVILSRLVRNNGWVAQRYAPEVRRKEELREVRRSLADVPGLHPMGAAVA